LYSLEDRETKRLYWSHPPREMLVPNISVWCQLFPRIPQTELYIYPVVCADDPNDIKSFRDTFVGLPFLLPNLKSFFF